MGSYIAPVYFYTISGKSKFMLLNVNMVENRLALTVVPVLDTVGKLYNAKKASQEFYCGSYQITTSLNSNR
jgi:hypothetical protein